MDFIAQYGTIVVIITAIAGFLMAFGIGANDVSNAMGTSVGSGTVTIRQAILIAMVFEFAGAYLAGGEVTETIKSGIIDPALFVEVPEVLILGMMAALFSAGTWLLLASYMGWPVSTTHSIIGAIIGFACVTLGPNTVEWGSVKGIVGSWFITPIISGIVAYTIFTSTQRLIFDTEISVAWRAAWACQKVSEKHPELFSSEQFLEISALAKSTSHQGLKRGCLCVCASCCA